MSENKSSKKYAFNTSWVLLEKISRIISGLFVGVLVARYLGPEQFGMIIKALNIVAVFSVFSSLGMDGIIVRELITRKEIKNTILGTSFWLRLIGSIIIVLGLTIFNFFAGNFQNTIIVFLVSFSVIIQSLTVVDLYFQSAVLGKFNAINQVVTLVVSSLIKIVLLVTNASVEYFAGMVLIESLLTAINQLYFYKINGELIKEWRFSLNEAKFLLKNSWPLILSALALIVYQKTDQFFIGQFLDLNSLGNYAAATRISEASYFIPVAVCAAVFPGIVNNRHDKELQIKRLTQLYSLMIWAGLIIIVGGLLFGDLVIPFLYKEKYNLAAGIFKIHIFTTIPVYFGCAWGMWMFAENKQKLIVIFQCVHLVINLGLNYMLIPYMGVKGAAVSFLIINYLSMFNMLTVYKHKLSWSIFIKAFHPQNLIAIYRYIMPSSKN